MHRLHLLLIHVVKLHAILAKSKLILAEIVQHSLIHVVRVLVMEEFVVQRVVHHEVLAVGCERDPVVDTVMTY